MPLVKADLQDDLESIFSDPGAYGDTAADMAAAWAAAVADYAGSVVPASTTVSGAEAALASALTTAFQSTGAAGMETAFASFATTVAGGMAPAFTGTPPAGQVGFAAQIAGPNPATHAAAAQAFASLIDTWMKTGTATPSGGGPPVNWT